MICGIANFDEKIKELTKCSDSDWFPDINHKYDAVAVFHAIKFYFWVSLLNIEERIIRQIISLSTKYILLSRRLLHRTGRGYEIFIKYANEGENYFSYIIVIISTLISSPRVITYCCFSRRLHKPSRHTVLQVHSPSAITLKELISLFLNHKT